MSVSANPSQLSSRVVLAQVVVLSAILGVWVSLSAAIVPIHAFANSAWVESFLQANNFTPLLLRRWDLLSGDELLRFVLLYVPRLAFLLLCLRMLIMQRHKSTRLMPISREMLIFVGAISGVCLIFNYLPGFIAGLYLMAYCIGRLSKKASSLVLSIPLLVCVLVLVDVGRGTFIAMLVAFILGRGRLDRVNTVILPTTIAVVLILLSFAKFDGTDQPIYANLYDRLSFFHQFKIYLFGVGPEYTVGKPVAIDLVTSQPIARSFFPQLDEARLFGDFTGGSVGGLAVGMEIRALAFWGDSNWKYLDLCAAFAMLYAIIGLFVRYAPFGRELVAIPFVSLIQFDSLNSAANFIQLVVLFALFIWVYQILNRRSQPVRVGRRVSSSVTAEGSSRRRSARGGSGNLNRLVR